MDALAVWRITTLVTEDRIAQPVRDAINSRSPEWARYLVSCRACVSFWAGVAVASGLVPRPVTRALALSALSMLGDRTIESVEGLVVAANRR